MTLHEPQGGAPSRAGGRAAPPPQRRGGGHLVEIDVLRVLTFACVIAVHTIDHSIDPDDRVLFVVLGLFHFTREVFFALTAFVLVYSWERRPQPMRRFLPRRFLLVGVPYVVWSAIYQAYYAVVEPGRTVLQDLGAFLLSLVQGTGAFHLYFLLVTLQVYLLFPLVLRLVQATRGHHALLVAVAAAAQLAVLAVWEYVPGLKTATGNTANATFTSYLFMIVGGAVAADHADAFLALLRRRRRAIVIAVVAAGALATVVFAGQAKAGFSLGNAVTALQPAILVWATAIGLGFLALGARYADRRTPGGRLDRALATGSDVSFGVFLVHPLAIFLALDIGSGFFRQVLQDPLRQLVLYVVVVAASVGFSYLVRRTPLSLPLTGRPWRRPSRPAPAG